MTIDPVQLAHGVTVTVNVPQMPQVCPAPEAPTPGGVTVPVQGGLTAEQLAHIVATVTAKVVEELGGQPGNVSWEAVQGKPAAFPPGAHRHNAADIDDLPSGGGAGIDDATIGTDTTWSSQKTSDELAGKAPGQWSSQLPMFGSEDGVPVGTGLVLDQALDAIAGAAFGAAESAVRFDMYLTSGVWSMDSGICVVDDESAIGRFATPGRLFLLRQPDGTVVWRIPTVAV